MTLGPGAREGEHVFGVAHIFASFNDTFVVRLTPAVPPVACRIVLRRDGAPCCATWARALAPLTPRSARRPPLAARDRPVWQGDPRSRDWCALGSSVTTGAPVWRLLDPRRPPLAVPPDFRISIAPLA